MNKIYWANLLHIYQPPKQDPEILKKIVNESYFNIIKLLKKFPKLKISLNISACLTELLVKYGHFEIIKEFKKLAQKKQIEFTGSAAYHPILPLLPTREIVRQIQLNNEINKKYFGSLFEPKGFFPPEMAYGPKLIPILENFKFQWIILDEISNTEPVDDRYKYFIAKTNLKVVFRSSFMSKMYVPDAVREMTRLPLKKDKYVVTATDGELYGHHHIDRERVFAKILKSKKIIPLTVSEFLKENGREKKEALLQTSTWETQLEDLKEKNPFPLWNDPKNKIHQMLWELADKTIDLVNKFKKDENYYWARLHLDRGLASCTFWWSSAKKPSPFSPITWNPDEVSKGATELIKAIRSLKSASQKEKILAERIYFKLQKQIWETHWKKYEK